MTIFKRKVRSSTITAIFIYSIFLSIVFFHFFDFFLDLSLFGAGSIKYVSNTCIVLSVSTQLIVNFG